MEKPATPLPWVSFHGHERGFNRAWVKTQPSPMLRGFTKEVAVLTGTVADDDAAYIVTACNAYPHLTAINAELVEALERIKDQYGRNPDTPSKDAAVMSGIAVTALARAKENSNGSD